MQIRTASAGDAEEIAGVHIASLRAAYRGLFGAKELARIVARNRAARWRDHMTTGSSITLLGEVEGRLVGFVDFGACGDEDVSPEAVGEVMAIDVRPDAWGLGFGGTLMRAAPARLRSGGSAEVVLWVIVGNRRAVGFYERLGFQPHGPVRLRERGRCTERLRRSCGSACSSRCDLKGQTRSAYPLGKKPNDVVDRPPPLAIFVAVRRVP
jgi:ribosomal protein S18 acetylase RimI-like enzyme